MFHVYFMLFHNALGFCFSIATQSFRSIYRNWSLAFYTRRHFTGLFGSYYTVFYFGKCLFAVETLHCFGKSPGWNSFWRESVGKCGCNVSEFSVVVIHYSLQYDFSTWVSEIRVHINVGRGVTIYYFGIEVELDV